MRKNMDKRPENKLLAEYIRAVLSGGCFDFKVTRDSFFFEGTGVDVGAREHVVDVGILDPAIKDFFLVRPEIAEIRGRIQTNTEGIESANIYFFDSDGVQAGAKMKWAEFRQKSKNLVVSDSMLQELASSAT
jgi:hypothetical protein